MGCLYKINRPSHLRRAIGFSEPTLLTSQASPNDIAIVVIITIVIIGKAEVLVHDGGIIAQTYPSRVDLVELAEQVDG